MRAKCWSRRRETASGCGKRRYCNDFKDRSLTRYNRGYNRNCFRLSMVSFFALWTGGQAAALIHTSPEQAWPGLLLLDQRALIEELTCPSGQRVHASRFGVLCPHGAIRSRNPRRWKRERVKPTTGNHDGILREIRQILAIWRLDQVRMESAHLRHSERRTRLFPENESCRMEHRDWSLPRHAAAICMEESGYAMTNRVDVLRRGLAQWPRPNDPRMYDAPALRPIRFTRSAEREIASFALRSER